MRIFSLFLLALLTGLGGCTSFGHCAEVFGGEYSALPKQKALYIDEKNAQCSYSYNAKSADEAKQLAFRNCQQKPGAQCMLYAENDVLSPMAAARHQEMYEGNQNSAQAMKGIGSVLAAAAPAIASGRPVNAPMAEALSSHISNLQNSKPANQQRDLPGINNDSQASSALSQPPLSTGGSSGPDSIIQMMDKAIVDARMALADVPNEVDGCPTTVQAIEKTLPYCARNPQLIKLRELALLTDASFRADLAAGLSLKEVAKRSAQAARAFDDALAQDEKVMLSMSASDSLARARLARLSEQPPSCDAGPPDAFGMSEQAYQAYVSSLIASKVNRTVSAIAACRARGAK